MPLLSQYSQVKQFFLCRYYTTKVKSWSYLQQKVPFYIGLRGFGTTTITFILADEKRIVISYRRESKRVAFWRASVPKRYRVLCGYIGECSQKESSKRYVFHFKLIHESYEVNSTRLASNPAKLYNEPYSTLQSMMRLLRSSLQNKKKKNNCLQATSKVKPTVNMKVYALAPSLKKHILICAMSLMLFPNFLE